MTITLYHATPSANSERVKIALIEKGLSYEGVVLNLARKDQKQPEFLKLNPYGKVPVIVDNGNVLFESCIINEYLDEHYRNPSLMPKDSHLRGRGRVLVDYALNHLQEPYWALRTEMRKPPAERNSAVLSQKRNTLRELLQYLEDSLEGKAYFLGEFSLTDINVWPRISRLETYGALPAPSLPRLSEWLQRMKQRPSVQSVLQLEEPEQCVDERVTMTTEPRRNAEERDSRIQGPGMVEPMISADYEDRLADAFEKLLADGTDDLTSLASGLNALGCKPPSGGTWAADSLAVELARLAAETGAWGSAGKSNPNDASIASPPVRMPLSSQQIFNTGLLNNWYLVCRASDVGAKPIRLTRLSRDIALWRDAGGQVHAVDDFCPHRGARLSAGHVVDNGLACAYHGVTVDGNGVVTSVPPVLACPLTGKRRIVGYPARETAGSIFLYFSDGIDDAVPDLELPPELVSNEWSGFLSAAEWKCNYLAVLDNRLDPIHASYLHTHTFTLAYGVKQSTILLNQTPQGFYIERDNQRGVNIDRTEVIHRPSNNYWIHTDIPYPKSAGSNFFRILSHLTPIDANRTYVWFFRCQKSSGWRRDLWRFLYKNRLEQRHEDVVAQDREIMEGIPTDAGDRENLIQTDVGLGRIRRMYKREADEQAARLKAHYGGQAAE